MCAMAEREDAHQLTNVVQMDDAYLGGELSGGTAGRGSENKVPFVAAVSLNETSTPTCLSLNGENMDDLSMVANTPIWLTRWGADGSRVVLVHGGAQGSEVGGAKHFAAQERLAERGWQVLVPDRPGHGRSPSPGRPDDAELDLAWVAELLGDGAHLVGHSFGGAVALAAAARRPCALRSLTLIEPALQKLATDNADVRRFGLSVLLSRIFSLSMASRARKFAKLVRIPDEIRGGRSPDQLRRMGEGLSQLRLPDKATITRQLVHMRDGKVPMLVVTGGWSPAFEATADRVAEIGGARRVVIASPHHFPQLVSDEFNGVLDEFMRCAEATRGDASVAA